MFLSRVGIAVEHLRTEAWMYPWFMGVDEHSGNIVLYACDDVPARFARTWLGFRVQVENWGGRYGVVEKLERCSESVRRGEDS